MLPNSYVALLVLILPIGGCARRRSRNLIPIEGQPLQWAERRNGHACEYFHYSIIERRTHSWMADCLQTCPNDHRL
jgi:hypothetical protein